MSKHVHADLIMQYALDAQVSQAPCEWWESKCQGDDVWNTLMEGDGFNIYRDYRRKADAPPLSVAPVLGKVLCPTHHTQADLCPTKDDSALTRFWGSAPEGADWLSIDSDGQHRWYEKEPEIDFGTWARVKGQEWDFDQIEPTKHQRPEHLRKSKKMIMCNGFKVADGDSSFCVGDNFYLPYVSSGLFYEEGVFTGHSYDRMVVSKGIAYRTKEGAISRAKAMLGMRCWGCDVGGLRDE
jgi:hypothetical protein